MQYDYVGFIVAAIIAVGGAIGYFKAGNDNPLQDMAKWMCQIII